MATAKRKNFKKAESERTDRPAAAADAATVIVQSALFYEI